MATGPDSSDYLCGHNFSIDDVDDLFLFEEDNFKSGPVLQIDADKESETRFDFSNSSLKTKNIEPKVDSFPTFTKFDVASSLLQCRTSDPAADLWEGVQTFFSEAECVDVEINENFKLLYGNFYQTPQDCSFMVSVARIEDSEDSLAEVTRLSGDAFLLQDLFGELKDYLQQMELLIEEEEEEYESESYDEDEDEEDEFELNFDDECSEDDDLDFSDFENSVIQFKNDKDLLHMMLNNFDRVHLEERNYYVSMLAHASQDQANVDLMFEKEEWATKVKQLVCYALESPKDSSNATLIRNTCVFLKNIVESMEIDDKILTAIVTAMGDWCPGHKDDGQNIGYLQSSRQVMIEIDQILAKLLEFSHEEIQKIVYNELEKPEIEIIVKYAKQALQFKSQFLKKIAQTS